MEIFSRVLLENRRGEVATGWGGRDFVPVASDYDGDMKTDPAVYNTVTGEWRFWLSSGGRSPLYRRA